MKKTRPPTPKPSKKDPGRASKPPREHPFEEYIVYRYRLREFLHLFDVMLHLNDCPELKPYPEEHMQTLRLVLVSHLAGFFDTRDDSLKAYEVWREYFPQHRKEIDATEKALKPLLGKALKLRHKAGAHSDLSLRRQNRARQNLSSRDTARILDRFFGLALLLSRSEKDVPEMAEEIATWQHLKPAEEIPL